MSMYWAGYYGQGLVLTESEFSGFLANYKAKCTNEEILRNLEYLENGDIDVWDVSFVTSTGIKFGVSFEGNDNTSGFRLIPYRIDGKPNTKWHKNEDIPSSDVYIIYSDKAIDGMECFDKKAYESYEEFLNEFKNKMDSCLPEDFDWDAHIGIYSYACFA